MESGWVDTAPGSALLAMTQLRGRPCKALNASISWLEEPSDLGKVTLSVPKGGHVAWSRCAGHGLVRISQEARVLLSRRDTHSLAE